MYSTNAGATWVDASTIAATNGGAAVGYDIQALAVYGGKLYAGDLDGNIYMSPDGNSWSGSSPGAAIDALSLYSGKLYAGDYGNGNVYVNAGGGSWSQTNGGAAVGTGIEALAVHDGKLFAGDESGYVYVSADGDSWSPTDSGATVGTDIQALASYSGKIYAGDYNGNIYVSADGNSWSATNGGSAVGSNIQVLAVYNGKLYAGDHDGNVFVSADGNSWSPTNGGNAVGTDIQTLAVFNGKLYAGDYSGDIYLSSDGNSWTPANSGSAVGSDIEALAAFNGRLYAGDADSGVIYQYSPVSAALSGSDGNTSAQTLTASSLNLVLSTSAATCGGASPCGATDQIKFTVTDLAGNAATYGPFAILVDSMAAIAVSTPSAPANMAFVNAVEASTFSWTGPSTTTAAGLSAGSYYWLQASSYPAFSLLAVSISTPVQVNSAKATADGVYYSTYTLQDVTTYYWRVAAVDGVLPAAGWARANGSAWRSPSPSR
jgi:hypothetical protein